MIKTLKAATNLSELMFICQEHGIVPVIADSLFLGLFLTKVLYEVYPDATLALLDSDTLLEVVEYNDTNELREYAKAKNLVAYKVNKYGAGEEIG